MTRMTSSERKTGVQGATVAANVKRLMEEQNLNSGSLARKSAEIDQPTELADGTAVKPAKLADLAIRRIVAGERKVDVDDLVLLAYALGVAPVTLMQPHTENQTEIVLTPICPTMSVMAWDWLIGQRKFGEMRWDGESHPDPVQAKVYDMAVRQYVMKVNPAWSREALHAMDPDTF